MAVSRSDSRVFDHPEADAEFTWLTDDQWQVTWTHKASGQLGGTLFAEFRDIPHPETGEPIRSVVFLTMNLHPQLQRRRVLRFLCRRMPRWLRRHGVQQVVIPRPDGGGETSETAFEEAGFRKDGVYGRRVASMVDTDGDGLTEVERIAEDGLKAEGISGPADTR